MKLFATVLVSTVVALSFATSSHAASTSPGKVGVYASTANATVPDNDTFTTLVTGTIEKGKKKRVLEVYVSFTGTNFPTNNALSVRPVVNGIALMEPTVAGTTAPASAAYWSNGTSIGSEFWLDLDAAEAAHPGVFIKQPLVIELQAKWPSVPPSAPLTGSATLRARLEKK